MEIYNIIEHGKEYDDTQIFTALKQLLKKETEYTPFLRHLLISDLIGYIKGVKLLTSTIKLLEDTQWIDNAKEIETSVLDCANNGNTYTSDELTRFVAVVFSIILTRNVLFEYYGISENENLPELNFKIEDKNVHTNIDEITKELKRILYGKLHLRNENLPLQERENDLKILLTSLAEIEYSYGSTYFEKEIRFFTLIKDNLPYSLPKKNPEQENPFDLIFTGTDDKSFNVFKSFIENHIIDEYLDYSFIFQQMKLDNLIHDMKHRIFMQWLRDNDYIREKLYQDFYEKNSFRSLDKSTSTRRLNDYIKIKDKFFPQYIK